MKYHVVVTRTASRTVTLTVEAENAKGAEELALRQAPNVAFTNSEHSADYEASAMMN